MRPRPRVTASRVLIGGLLTGALLLAGCTQSGSDPGSTDTGPGGQPSPGVTADAVNVGYLVVDIGTLSETLGFKTIKDGGYETTAKSVQAVVDYVNANGGAGGRTINAVIKPYVAQQDTPEYAEAQCRAFTQDSQVFAVVMDGQFQNNSRPCYQAGRAIMLDQTLIAHDQTEFQQFSPFLWSPSLPTYDAFVLKQLEVLQGAGWFNGAKGVAVVAPDTEVSRRVAQTVVTPWLQRNGQTNAAEFYIDGSNAGTLGASTSAALTSAQGRGIDRVFVVGGARILPVMVSSAEADAIPATYSISSYDNPAFFVDNPETIVTKTRIGMAGLGMQPGSDMRQDSSQAPFPDPARPNEVLCKQIIDAAGAQPPEPNRENYRVAMQFCDGTLLLKAALDRAPKDLTPNAFRDAVWGLGNTWTAAITYGSAWAPNQYAGATVVRGMFWDDACRLSTGQQGCFRWGTGDLPLTQPQAAAPPAQQGTAPVQPAPAATP